MTSIAILTIGLYLIIVNLHWLAMSRSSVVGLPRLKASIFGISFITLCLHAMLLHAWIDQPVGQNLDFVNLLSTTLWFVALLFMGIVVVRPIAVISGIVYPLNALSIALILFFPHRFILATAHQPHALFHILLSVATVSVMALATLLAVLLCCQDRWLRRKRWVWLMPYLPAMAGIERLLAQVLVVGFVLLSVVLLTSLVFFETGPWPILALWSKLIMTFVVWVVFAVLLVGRIVWGWRGRHVIYGTLLGMLLLTMVYFGSKSAIPAGNRFRVPMRGPSQAQRSQKGGKSTISPLLNRHRVRSSGNGW